MYRKDSDTVADAENLQESDISFEEIWDEIQCSSKNLVDQENLQPPDPYLCFNLPLQFHQKSRYLFENCVQTHEKLPTSRSLRNTQH